ncbi:MULTISPECIES: beta-ketoacyl synthase N-terminal-like domain-containing protein [unclassified Variovorax]|jgi:3-oxoacyl-[acyl-carrier-protein] synthase-1|uniref:beta-ketoacyl synthase N-terminal-like domain-containing protein n=1 Tax=unclassified Variovorax TaxID=663243 RepID=UPI000F7F45E0|nr:MULTISPECIES: beta-ketoacyl synthase N-terminal-like domain-containing protein [unclassified Variovorax]RSZ33824.1 beta-ketoacyl synthase [Variovorax sp. 553]RSZ34179.1 beta-ketoacyl synthase [Variovorax sp. 679]
MSAVYLAGMGLACALGEDMPSALASLRHGGVPPVMVDVAEGFRWPVHALAKKQGDWTQRLRDLVRGVVAQTGDWGPRTAPLFVASSSLDIGFMEHEQQDLRLGGDLQDFASVVADALGWQGPVFTVSTACTSALNAVLAAADLIRADEADEALVIGAEMGNRFTVAGFGAMQLLAPDSARPFGEGRNGLVLGEAVAVLRMTSQPSRWQIAGGANVVDGRNPSGTEATAVHAMCSGALAQSGLRPGDIDLIKVQAAGSPVNDAIEAEALKQVFEPLPPLVSLKSALGHTLGASGAAELALLVGCIEGAAWPAVDYPLDASLGIALSEQVPRRLRNILLNFAGFGGGHASLVLKDTGP